MEIVSDENILVFASEQLNSILIKKNVDIRSTTEETVEGYESLRHAFTQLVIFGKFFGIFPSYNCSFKVDSSKEPTHRKKWLQLADYLYTISIFLLIVGGVVYCTIKEPRVITKLKGGHAVTDYYVIMFLFYLTTVTGIFSYSVFLKKRCPLLKYIEHFSHVDKLLKFDQQKRELSFSRIMLGATVFICLTYGMGALCLFVLDLQDDYVSSQVEFITSDWIMVSLTTITGTLFFMPTLFLIFFLNAIKLRLECFNIRIQHTCSIYTYTTPILNTSHTFVQKHNIDYSHSIHIDYAKQLEALRMLHEELLMLIEETSSIFGVHLLRSYFYSIVGFILFAYFTLFLREDFYQYWFLYPAYDVVILIKLFVISSSAHYVYSQGEDLKHILNKVPIVNIHPLSSLQIQLLLRKLDFPITLNAAGFFSINRLLLTKIIGAITTYFIVLLQFKTSEFKS